MTDRTPPSVVVEKREHALHLVDRLGGYRYLLMDGDKVLWRSSFAYSSEESAKQAGERRAKDWWF